MIPQIGEQYFYGDIKVQIVSDDYTELNRNIVYAQIIKYLETRVLSKNEVLNTMKNNIYDPAIITVWVFDWKNLKTIN